MAPELVAPATAGRATRRELLGGAMCLAVAAVGLDTTVTGAAVVLQGIFVVYFLRHFAFAVSALRSAPTDLWLPAPADPSYRPPVSVIVACKNEESVIAGLVKSLMALDYPRDRLQVILVNDGSTDGTGALLDELAALHPSLQCIHRRPGSLKGKSAALNTALSSVEGEIIVVFDADHQPRPDVVTHLVRHFRDPRVGAVQGRCEIGNAADSLLSRLIAIDYLAGYLVNEYGRQSLFRLPAYGGANCAVRTESLRRVGGWNVHSVTEDTDLTMRLRLRGEKVRYDVHAVDREEGVVTLGRFWRQRYRWARGHQQVCRDYRRQVWRASTLSPAEKVETLLFLFTFHVPVAAAMGLIIIGLSISGLAQPAAPLGLEVFWTLLFLGPLLELGAGLLVADADRREALALAYFLPLFLISIALCTKAWLDGLRTRPYEWVKTTRGADPVAGPVTV